MSTTNSNWTKEDFIIYTLIYCANADYVEEKLELDYIKSKINTSNLENLKEDGPVVLQLLSSEHSKVVRPLGLKSGFKFDKEKWLSEKYYYQVELMKLYQNQFGYQNHRLNQI